MDVKKLMPIVALAVPIGVIAYLATRPPKPKEGGEVGIGVYRGVKMELPKGLVKLESEEDILSFSYESLQTVPPTGVRIFCKVLAGDPPPTLYLQLLGRFAGTTTWYHITDLRLIGTFNPGETGELKVPKEDIALALGVMAGEVVEVKGYAKLENPLGTWEGETSVLSIIPYPGVPPSGEVTVGAE